MRGWSAGRPWVWKGPACATSCRSGSRSGATSPTSSWFATPSTWQDLDSASQYLPTSTTASICWRATSFGGSTFADGPAGYTMDCGYGGVGAGTARWLGLTPTAVRQSAGLPARQPSALVLPEVGELPRPRGVGPLVLLGGGPTPAEALQTVELARRPDSSTLHIALITAAPPGSATTEDGDWNLALHWRVSAAQYWSRCRADAGQNARPRTASTPRWATATRPELTSATASGWSRKVVEVRPLPPLTVESLKLPYPTSRVRAPCGDRRRWRPRQGRPWRLRAFPGPTARGPVPRRPAAVGGPRPGT